MTIVCMRAAAARVFECVVRSELLVPVFARVHTHVFFFSFFFFFFFFFCAHSGSFHSVLLFSLFSTFINIAFCSCSVNPILCLSSCLFLLALTS